MGCDCHKMMHPHCYGKLKQKIDELEEALTCLRLDTALNAQMEKPETVKPKRKR